MQMLSNYSRYFPGQDLARRQTEDFQHWRMHNRQAALVGTTTVLNVSIIYMVGNLT